MVLDDWKRRYLRRVEPATPVASLIGTAPPVCARCGDGGGTLHLDATETTPDGQELRWMRHTDPDECITGDPAYDAQTRLNLRFNGSAASLPRVPRQAGIQALDLTCPRRGARHSLGGVYAVRDGLLLLAVYDTSNRSSKPRHVDAAGNKLRTIRVRLIQPTFLHEDDAVVTAVRCDCGEVALTPAVRAGLAEEARDALGRRAGATRHAVTGQRPPLKDVSG